MGSTVDGILPGRENELEQLEKMLRRALEHSTGTCIYVSGVPGTGKTASVKCVLTKLRLASQCDKSKIEKLPDFKSVWINGLQMTDPKQSYVHFYKGLVDPANNVRMSGSKAQTLLDPLLTNLKEPVILVLDELDTLTSRSSTLLYQYVEWAVRPTSRFILVMIANRMDLPETYLANRVASRMGMERVNFGPYSANQLKTILLQCEEVDGSSGDALELCVKRVANGSGDIRKAIALWKRAVQLATRRDMSDATENDGARWQPNRTSPVTLSIMLEAMKEMYSAIGPTNVVTSLPFMHKIILACLLKCSDIAATSESSKFSLENGGITPTKTKVFEMVWQYCRSFSLPIPSLSDLQRILYLLRDARLVGIENLASTNVLGLGEEVFLTAMGKDEWKNVLKAYNNEYLNKIIN